MTTERGDDPIERASLLLDHIEELEDELARLRAENNDLRNRLETATS